MTTDYLRMRVKDYEELTKVISQKKQRLAAYYGVDVDSSQFDPLLKGEKGMEGLETQKARAARDIEKALKLFDVWELWLKNIPGIGPAIAGSLVLLYYSKNVAICQKCEGDLEKIEGGLQCSVCGAKAKKDGVLKYREETRDFPNISKWWAFMGRHTVDGVMPKRKAGVVSNWSTKGRTLGFHIGDQFNRQKEDHPYKAFMLERKRKHAKSNPDWTIGHIHNAAKNEAVKLFLAHFWTVAREIDELPVTEAYAGTIMGHTGIIRPFYWDEPEKVEAVG
jgi:hypothetical protein